MTVEIQCNGTALFPQPRDVNWESVQVSGKLDGTDAIGAYEILVLKAPPEAGGTANWNWSNFENSVLTSVQAPARFDNTFGTAVTYNSGVVSERIKRIDSTVGNVINGVEMRIKVVV